MIEKKPTYLEQHLEADLTRDNGYIFTFQLEKIKLDHRMEVDMIKELNPSFQKDIVMTDDELKITVHPPSDYLDFESIHTKNKRSKWLFAHQLVKKVNRHALHRLHQIVCPENIVFDPSFEPAFLHYGVMESIPPYEKDEQKLWAELKATVAVAVEGKHTFEEYLHLHETLQLSSLAKEIMTSTDQHALETLIQKHMDRLEQQNASLIHIPQKKWKLYRYIGIGMCVCFIPALLFALYFFFIQQPKLEAFVQSSEYFLHDEYDAMIDVLENYSAEDMPETIQYGLATSYVMHESLTDDQRENVQNTIALQSEPQFYAYWIHIGRDQNEEALDIARSLEDHELIMFALLKHREQIRADTELSGEEKQEKLRDVEREIDEYIQEQEEREQEEANTEEDKPEEGKEETEDEETNEAEEKNEENDEGEAEDKNEE